MSFNRIDRVSEEVKRELASLIRELKDPRINEFTSVTGVSITNDFKFAKAYISVIGDEQSAADTVEGLKRAAGFIRREIGQRLKLRYTPQFSFEYDKSIQYGAHISQVLSSLDVGGKEDAEENSTEA
ncbi:MAG: 30S ribosome-binding factor RbfA [Clostridia bacterium]|nr:30S ribosome-binding factor RbfA [Clostridia bacterium]